jgi:hypothetical protein
MLLLAVDGRMESSFTSGESKFVRCITLVVVMTGDANPPARTRMVSEDRGPLDLFSNNVGGSWPVSCQIVPGHGFNISLRHSWSNGPHTHALIEN